MYTKQQFQHLHWPRSHWPWLDLNCFKVFQFVVVWFIILQLSICRNPLVMISIWPRRKTKYEDFLNIATFYVVNLIILFSLMVLKLLMYFWLLRCCTNRGYSAGFSLVSPTKVEACKFFLLVPTFSPEDH